MEVNEKEQGWAAPAPLVAALAEWSLPSEPWLFLIDGQGKVVARYEGGIGLTELDPAVKQLVGEQ